ncbi:MAG: hypothetical protein IPK63_17725 [Candidatus Competibacteraceae bacterium]|nr:hypothetical protein [Candidatus Competibacteraceae bacterium]
MMGHQSPELDRADADALCRFCLGYRKLSPGYQQYCQLLAIAPALEAAGAEPLSEEAVATEINAARQARGQEQSRNPRSMRLVLYTNVVFSALLWRGKPYQLLDTVSQRPDVYLFSSPALLGDPPWAFRLPGGSMPRPGSGHERPSLMFDFATAWLI